MKKNKMMRIASVLLVAVLISTCAISGTFAKYVTKVSGTDKARVAKWGILLTLDASSLFSDEYEADDDTYTGEGDWEGITVKADNGDNLVAPGTGVEDAIVATVTGQPEVATRYALVIDTNELKDVILPAGTYTDYTELVLYPLTEDDEGYDEELVGTYGYYNTFTIDKAYTPVKWDISVTKGSKTLTLSEVAAGYQSILDANNYCSYGFSLTDVQEILTGTYKDALLNLLTSVVSNASNPQVTEEDGKVIISLDFNPNKEMDFTFNLSWKWAFEATEATEAVVGDDGEVVTPAQPANTYPNDKADTYLGNVAAGVIELEEGSKISTDLKAVVTASATQID